MSVNKKAAGAEISETDWAQTFHLTYTMQRKKKRSLRQTFNNTITIWYYWKFDAKSVFSDASCMLGGMFEINQFLSLPIAVDSSQSLQVAVSIRWSTTKLTTAWLHCSCTSGLAIRRYCKKQFCVSKLPLDKRFSLADPPKKILWLAMYQLSN